MGHFLTVPTAILTAMMLIAGCASNDDIIADEATTAFPATTAIGHNVLYLPEYTPAGLVLAGAEMADAHGRPTDDADEAASISLTYLLPEKPTPALHIYVEDRLALAPALQEQHHIHPVCDITVGGELDAGACIAHQIENAEQLHGTDGMFEFTELTVRGHRGLLEERTTSMEGAEDLRALWLTVYEGGSIVTTVSSGEIDPEEVVRVAERLQPATPDEFANVSPTIPPGDPRHS